jgi:osmoprotectant transport system substrate-binding protein
MVLRGLLAACLALVLTGCGAGSGGGGTEKESAEGPGAGKPPVTLATKNFTEQFVLGQLYKQALEAKGFTVRLKQDVGSSELVDRALTHHSIDLYPEYVGVIVTEIAHEGARQRSPADTYRRAKAFEAGRGFVLLAPTPGYDALANAVKPAYARTHGLRRTSDLRKLSAFRYGGPPENRTRMQGSAGLRAVYGVRHFTDVPLEGAQRYTALDHGDVDVTQVFSTEGQLVERTRYRVLEDDKGLYGFQNIAPVVDRKVLRRQGPAFRQTLDAVDATLTNRALQQMNGAVDLRGEAPADVARRFIDAHHLV